jgi:hypothetical protein
MLEERIRRAADASRPPKFSRSLRLNAAHALAACCVTRTRGEKIFGKKQKIS